MVAIFGASDNAQSRMYQWSNKATDRVQLSGSPPAWYRSERRGPRVLVFDNGVLIDDTALAVSEAHRQALRAAALQDANPARSDVPTQAQNRSIETVSVPETFDSTIRSADTSSIQAPPLLEEPASSAIASTVAELRSLIQTWDKQQLNKAKALLKESDELSGTK